MDAALLMSKTASLFRCVGKTLHDPATLLATLNRELCETSIHGMFVTMACGVLDTASGSVRLANAGHEPPLIHRADGSFVAIPASAPPLGILPLEVGHDGIREELFTLDGGTLYIFTDGVTEGRLAGGKRLDVQGFKEIISRRAAEPATRRIESVVAQLRDGGEQRHDDITILAVEDPSRPMTKTGGADPLVSLTFAARAEELHPVRERVRETCEQCGCPPGLAQDLVIAIGEACQNVVRHAYKGVDDGKATLEIRCVDGMMEFCLTDAAPPVDREKVKPVWPKEVHPGGLGLCLIHNIMDRVEYLPAPSGRGNLLRMVKYLKRYRG
jgi:sigma-B regulation protein RsbU (phosphoserine phosphatase)